MLVLVLLVRSTIRGMELCSSDDAKADSIIATVLAVGCIVFCPKILTIHFALFRVVGIIRRSSSTCAGWRCECGG